MLQKAIDRKNFYKELGKENNVVLEKVEIVKHKQVPNTYFIHANYMIGDAGNYDPNEVFEAYEEEREWTDIKPKMTQEEYSAFLGDCEVCNFD